MNKILIIWNESQLWKLGHSKELKIPNDIGTISQEYDISITNALKLPQSYTKPSKWHLPVGWDASESWVVRIYDIRSKRILIPNLIKSRLPITYCSVDKLICYFTQGMAVPLLSSVHISKTI